MFNKKNKKNNNLDVLETDLLRDEIDIEFNYKKDLTPGLILLGVALFILIEAFVFLVLWEKKIELKNSHYLENEITLVRSEMAELNEQYSRSTQFRSQLSIVNEAFSRHIYWTNLFNFLETNTLKNNIYYQKFSGDISGKYILPAISNDVRAMSFQSKYLSLQPMVSNVSVEGEEIINDDNGKTLINFNLNLNLDNKIFN
jgi:hypothetical protein